MTTRGEVPDLRAACEVLRAHLAEDIGTFRALVDGFPDSAELATAMVIVAGRLVERSAAAGAATVDEVLDELLLDLEVDAPD